MNLGVSAFFLLGILRLYGGVMHLLAACFLTYGIVRFRIGGRKYMPWIVLVGAMSHMLYTHCMREFGQVPVTTMEISSMQMVLVMNLTSFAWNCYDGQLRTDKQLDEVQMRDRVMTMPSLLEFFGYWYVVWINAAFTSLACSWGRHRASVSTSSGRMARCMRRTAACRSPAGARRARSSSRPVSRLC